MLVEFTIVIIDIDILCCYWTHVSKCFDKEYNK